MTGWDWQAGNKISNVSSFFIGGVSLGEWFLNRFFEGLRLLSRPVVIGTGCGVRSVSPLMYAPDPNGSFAV